MSLGGLVVGATGQVKQGKTMFTVLHALMVKAEFLLAADYDLPVWSNMRSLVCTEKGSPWYGKRWGHHIPIDDIMRDLSLPAGKGELRNGILILDELHHLMAAEFTRGIGGNILSNSVTQFAKRGVCFLFNTHMPRMIDGRIWGITNMRVHVKTNNYGASLLLDVRDQQSYNEAYQEGGMYPEDESLCWHDTSWVRRWYDANEPMSPFALSESVLQTGRWKQINKGLHAGQKEEPAKELPYVPVTAVMDREIAGELVSRKRVGPSGGNRVTPGKGVKEPVAIGR